MRVLIVSTYDIAGGASRSSYRLHQSLLSEGIDSHILVQKKLSNDHSVVEVDSKLERKFAEIRPFIDYFPVRFYKKRTDTLFSPAYFPFSSIIKKINEINPDVVHLQWISGGMLKIKDLANIKAPIVWGLNDMWSFTGGCHYDEHCGRYQKSCGKCKVLGSSKEKDWSYRLQKQKQKSYSKIKNLTVVGHSKWLADCARNSSVFKDKNVVNMPTPIDIKRFEPLDKNFCRGIFNLPKNKKLILFGAMGPTSDKRKGFIELSEAIDMLDIDNVELIIFGSGKPKVPTELKFKTHYISRINDDISLQILYSAVDVMIVPSIQENLSNIILESLSCATPVVAFDIGGNGDMVKHKYNGYLAKAFDTSDLSVGIEWIINNSDYEQICLNSRKKIKEEFSNKVVANKYINFYSQLLKSS
jgi:glycosyltransferase involved in cell wall biosynthesis